MRVDVTLDSEGWVVVGEVAEGMSVQFDDPRGAPSYRLPEALGGTSQGTLYEIRESDLPPLLEFVPDHGKHGVIRPRRRCRLEEFEEALGETRKYWRKTDVDEFS